MLLHGDAQAGRACCAADNGWQTLKIKGLRPQAVMTRLPHESPNPQ